MLKRIEEFISEKLRNHEKIKSFIKNVYQRFFWLISDKKKVVGNVSRISPNDNYEYFFGYYDKTPWCSSDRYMLCLRVKDACCNPAPNEEAQIIVIDTSDKKSYKVVATTNAWNTQMGCRLQWLGPDFNKRIIYNCYREGKLCSVIYNIENGEENEICYPVYDVSNDGTFALSLDFARLHRMRPGYGYSNITENQIDKLPNVPCIYRVDLIDNKLQPILTYKDLFNFETRDVMIDAEHKVNHIMINPSGTRFMVLHRWFAPPNSKKYTRLRTADCNGKNLYNLLDDNFTSHSCWKDNNHILTFANKACKGKGYFMLTDLTSSCVNVLESLKIDGHPSYSPDGANIITDTYPNRERKQKIFLCKADDYTVKLLASIYTPFKYNSVLRCDLHPRWNNKSDMICFDGTFEGKRGLYIVDNIKS